MPYIFRLAFFALTNFQSISSCFSNLRFHLYFTQCFQNLEFEVGFRFAPHPQGSNYIYNMVSLRALI